MIFFSKKENLEKIESLSNQTGELINANSFTEKNRELEIRTTEIILKTILLMPEIWDKECINTIKRYENDYNKLIFNRESVDISDEATIERIIVITIGTYQEFFFSIDHEKFINNKNLQNITNLINQNIKKILENKDSFNSRNTLEIEFIKNDLRFYSIKERFFYDDHYKYVEKAYSIKDTIDTWQKELSAQKKELKDLSSTLEKQKENFNFVGLYAGFNDIFQEKRAETNASLTLSILIGVAMVLIPTIFLMTTLVGHTPQEESVYREAIRLIPLAALEIILIYFFRISITEYKSLKNQLLQIKLRMTLCRFIDRYVTYSKKFGKDVPSLEKFENVIFSNIIPDTNNIPSTFDGLDQIAHLIGKIRGGKTTQ